MDLFFILKSMLRWILCVKKSTLDQFNAFNQVFTLLYLLKLRLICSNSPQCKLSAFMASISVVQKTPPLLVIKNLLLSIVCIEVSWTRNLDNQTIGSFLFQRIRSWQLALPFCSLVDFSGISNHANPDPVGFFYPFCHSRLQPETLNSI